MGRHSAGKLDAGRLSVYFEASQIKKFSEVLKRLISNRQVEIIYAHSSIMNFVPMLLFFGAKQSLVIHNPKGFESRRGLLGVYDETLFRFQLLLVPNRIFLSNRVKSTYKHRSNDLLIGEFVKPTKILRNISKVSRILFFGRNLTYKNIELVYHLSKVTKYQFTIASSGCNYTDTPNCKVINTHISDVEVDNLFRSHDILILPYLEVSQSGPFYLGLEYGQTILCSRLQFFESYSDLPNVILHQNELGAYKHTLEKLFE